MKKFLLFAFTFIALSSSVVAQNNKDFPKPQKQEIISVEDRYFRISFLPLTGEYEAKLGAHQTFIAKAGLASAFGASYSTYEESSSYLAIFPKISVGTRHYYNLEKRSAKGKFTAGNSGNYVSAMTSLTLPPVYMSEGLEYTGGVIYTFGGLWGIQRSYPNGFSLNLGIGYGVSGNGNAAAYGLIGEFGLGIHFDK